MNPDKNQMQQHLQLCRQILLPRKGSLRLCDPWAMQLKLHQMGKGLVKCPAP